MESKIVSKLWKGISPLLLQGSSSEKQQIHGENAEYFPHGLGIAGSVLKTSVQRGHVDVT